MALSKETTVRILSIYIGIFITISFAIATAVFSKIEIINIFRNDLVEGILVVAVSGATIAWFGLYFYTVLNELLILKEHLDKAIMPDLGFKTLVITFFIAVFFGLTLSSIWVFGLMYYLIFALLLRLFDMFGGSIINRSVFSIVKSEIFTNKRIDKKRKEALLVISDYYLKNLILLRCAIMVFFFFVSLILYLYYLNYKINLLLYSSYLVVFITIVIGESIIGHWRIKRSRQLNKIE